MNWSHFDSLLSPAVGTLPQTLGDFLAPRKLTPRDGRYASVNAWVTDDQVVLQTELPGLTADQVELSVEGEQLTLAGEVPARQLGEGESWHRQERFQGKFRRSLQLPFRVNASAVEAHFANGLLTVTLPRAAEDKPRRIEVRS